MTQPPPQHILCAVRGGPESRATVARATAMALEFDAALTFFNIVDAEFLGHATPLPAPLKVVYRELREMGEFSLMILCDQARREGVERVRSVVRQGDIREQLHQMAVETNATILVMGRPVRSPGSNVFTTANYTAFVAELARAGHLQVVSVMPEQQA